VAAAHTGTPVSGHGSTHLRDALSILLVDRV
jgi:hypothetical protein